MFLISIHLSRYFVRDGKGDSTKQIPVTITTSTLSPPVNYQKPVAQWQTHIYVQRKIWISRWVRLNLSVIERPGENIRSISHLQANVDGSQWILQIQYIHLFIWFLTNSLEREKETYMCMMCWSTGKKRNCRKNKKVVQSCFALARLQCTCTSGMSSVAKHFFKKHAKGIRKCKIKKKAKPTQHSLQRY